jgi:hypothetical protein
MNVKFFTIEPELRRELELALQAATNLKSQENDLK